MKKLLVLTIAALAAASCATMETMGGKKRITAPSPVTVVVQEIAGTPTTCRIAPPGKEDEIHVPPGTWPVTWVLQAPPGYQFDPNVGITFPTSGSGIFTNKVVTATTFSFTDNNTGQLPGGVNSHGKFPYHIHVEKPGTPKITCKLDPSVVNDDASLYQ
jgi:hypothetical protein